MDEYKAWVEDGHSGSHPLLSCPGKLCPFLCASFQDLRGKFPTTSAA